VNPGEREKISACERFDIQRGQAVVEWGLDKHAKKRGERCKRWGSSLKKNTEGNINSSSIKEEGRATGKKIESR